MTTTEPPGPALACPGCGSPDVNLGCGLLCGTCAGTAAIAQPEAPPIPVVTREQVREMVSAAIDAALWDAESPPASEAVLEVVWPLLKRAQAAEAKLAEVRAVLLEGGQDHGTVRRRALAITGSEEEAVFARQLVAQAKAADDGYKVAAVRAGLYEFLHQYGHSMLPTFKVAIDLAVSLRKIIDDLDSGEPGDGG